MVRSLEEEFETSIDEDLAWRRVEIQALATEVRRATSLNRDSPLSRALVRSMSTMLYAHWEGYCKHLFDEYGRLVAKLKPAVTDVNDALAMQHLQQAFSRLRSGDAEVEAAFLSLIRGESSERIRLQRSAMSDTKANLRYKVLCQLLAGFGVSEKEFATKDKLIDTLLCDRRNSIAHGRASFPRADEVLELRDNLDSMMDTLRNLFVGEVRSRGYRRRA